MGRIFHRTGSCLFALGAVLAALSGFAIEITWQGSDGASWSAAGNWVGGVVPTASDVAVFNPGSGVSRSVVLSGVTDIRGVKVLSGTVTLGQQDVTKRYLRMNADSKGCSDVFVAEGAVLYVNCGMLPARPNESVFRKSGAGASRFRGPLGDANEWIASGVRQGFAQIDLAGGTIESYQNGTMFYTTNILVRSGATWHLRNYNTMMFPHPDVHLEKGGSFRTYDGNDILASVTGEGHLYGRDNGNNTDNGSCTISLERGPCRFDGQIGSATLANNAYQVTFSAQGTKSDADYSFVVGSSNTLSALSAIVFSNESSPRAVTNCPIKFAAGVGRFDFYVLNCKKDAPLVLEDVEGNPVDVYAMNLGDCNWRFQNSEKFAVKGKGNVYFRHQPGTWRRWEIPFTNACFRSTGEIGAADDGYVTFGDGKAGHNPDLSTVARIVAKDAKSHVVFNQYGATTVPCPVLMSAGGTFTAKSALTVPRLVTPTEIPATVEAQTNLTLDASATGGETWLARVNGVSPASGTVAFTKGFYHAAYALPYYYQPAHSAGDWVRRLAEPGPFRITHPAFSVTDADVWVDGSLSSFNSITVGPGGVLHAYGNMPGSAVGYGRITLDGGEYQCFYIQSYGQDTIPNGTQGCWTFRVTERGGRLTDTYNWRARGSSWTRPLIFGDFASGAAEGNEPGELSLSFRGAVEVYRPLVTGGDIRLESGIFYPVSNAVMAAAISSGTFLGTKDLTLDCTTVNMGTTWSGGALSDLKPKFAAFGGKLRLAGPALICGRYGSSAAQTMTFGDGTGNPFVRERGGFLVLSDGKSGTAQFDGSGVKAFMNGATAELDPTTGILKDPVFGAAFCTGGAGVDIYRFDFLTQYYNLAQYGKNGLLRACSYTTGVEGGANTIALVSKATTLAEDAQVAALNINGYPLTIKAGCTLKVGKDDTEHPACVLTRQSAASWGGDPKGDILGGGTLDFGKSEGLIVAGRTDRVRRACAFNCVIAGSGGLSIGGVSRYELNAGVLELGGENTYTGDTYVGGAEVRVRSLGAFSSGHVHVTYGNYNGGRIRFAKSGTYENEWTVGGIGPMLVSYRGLEPGCLVFNADVTLAGPVHVERLARFSTSNASEQLSDGHIYGYVAFDPGTGVFAGEISGGEVQVAGSSLSNYERKPIVFTHVNSYTGGTSIVGQDLILRGDGDCGTGKVLMASSANLTFENDAEKTFPNMIEGIGVVKLAGAAPVHFTGTVKRESWCDLRLDLAGTAPVFTEAPPFGVVTNTSAQTVHVTLRGDMGLDPSSYAYLDPNVRVTADGGLVDLCGGTLSVYRAERLNGGRFVNGKVVEANPVHGLSVFILR